MRNAKEGTRKETLFKLSKQVAMEARAKTLPTGAIDDLAYVAMDIGLSEDEVNNTVLSAFSDVFLKREPSPYDGLAASNKGWRTKWTKHANLYKE